MLGLHQVTPRGISHEDIFLWIVYCSDTALITNTYRGEGANITVWYVAGGQNIKWHEAGLNLHPFLAL